jgi:hypothetical protein
LALFKGSDKREQGGYGSKSRRYGLRHDRAERCGAFRMRLPRALNKEHRPGSTLHGLCYSAPIVDIFLEWFSECHAFKVKSLLIARQADSDAFNNKIGQGDRIGTSLLF